MALACSTFQAPSSGERGSCLPFPLREILPLFVKFITPGCHFFLNGGRAFSSPKARGTFTVPAVDPSVARCTENRGSTVSMNLIEQNGMEGGDSSRAGPCPQGIRWRHREATDRQKANCGLRLEMSTEMPLKGRFEYIEHPSLRELEELSFMC